MAHNNALMSRCALAGGCTYELHFCPQGRQLIAACGSGYATRGTGPGFIHVVDTERLHVLSTLNLDVAARVLQVVNIDGRDQICFLTEEGVHLHFASDLALIREANLRGFSMAATSSALAVGSHNKVLFLHP